MKLHEAIRLGSMNRPQIFGALSAPQGTCAVGAAMDALGVLELPMASRNAEFLEAFLVLKVIRPCPTDKNCEQNHIFPQGIPMVSVIMHLNDYHRWTREAIADYVESIEAQEKVESDLRVAQEVLIGDK